MPYLGISLDSERDCEDISKRKCCPRSPDVKAYQIGHTRPWCQRTFLSTPPHLPLISIPEDFPGAPRLNSASRSGGLFNIPVSLPAPRLQMIPEATGDNFSGFTQSLRPPLPSARGREPLCARAHPRPPPPGVGESIHPRASRWAFPALA